MIMIAYVTRAKFDRQCLQKDKVIFNHKNVMNI